MKEKKSTNRILTALLWLLCICMFLPMVFIIINAFKPFDQVVMDPLALPEVWNLDNFREVMKTGNYVKVLGLTKFCLY